MAKNAPKQKMSTKFRVGSRKGGTSALVMSTEALLKALKNPAMKRYKDNICQVLHKRGVA